INLFNFSGTVTLALTILLYLSFFTIPLGLVFAFKIRSQPVITVALCAVIIFIQLQFLSPEEFPSLTNVFSRKGLFQDIDGNKIHWVGYHKFFTYSFYLSVATLSLVLAKFLLNAKQIFLENKFLVSSFAIYFGLCLVLPVFYD